MAACRRFSNVAKRSKILLYKSRRFCSTNLQANADFTKAEEIIVPYRIQRGPTDILKALQSTVSKDYTAAQYKYEDDPFFIPASNITKRAFALSKESGKKAARYFLEKYPELFKCNTSVPYIKAFDPPVVYNEENVSSCDTLIECIKNFEVNNSITVYEILKEKGIAVNQGIKQDLLELLCFYNGIQPIDEDYYEERYFNRRDRLYEKWNAKGVAARLFDEMEKDSKAYSALIAGTAKFQNAKRALELFEEMKSKNLIPTVQAYNSFISLIPYMNEKRNLGCEYTLFILNEMCSYGLLPDLYTMNAVLEVFLQTKYKGAKKLALDLLAEMKRLKIEPSLGTYKLLIDIFCVANSVDIGILYEIMNEIEGKEFTARHPLDVMFFCTAMKMCAVFAQDKDLAYRINKLVEFGNNCKLLGNAVLESMYFKNFLGLLCRKENIDKFMEIYEQYVPNIYTPEPSVMSEILQEIYFNGHFKYLPKLCSDFHLFELTETENILPLIMEAAGFMKYEKEIQKELVDVLWKIVEKLNSRLEKKRVYFNWTGALLGNALNTFLNGSDLEKSWFIMKQLKNEEDKIIGHPEKNTLLQFCEFFLQNQEYDKVKFCIMYSMEDAYPNFNEDFKILVDDMFEKGKLQTKHRVHVDSILQSFSSVDDTSSDSPSVDASSNSSVDDTSNSSSSDDDTSSDSSSDDEEDHK